MTKEKKIDYKKYLSALKSRFNMKNLLSLIGRVAGYIDCMILYNIGDWVYKGGLGEDKKNYGLIFWAIALVWLVKCLKWEWLVFKSKKIIENDGYNSRVLAFEGGQGRGKTSLMCYTASVLTRRVGDIYSNVPVKINKKFAYILDKNHLSMKKRLKENSVVMLDEISLFYHNLDLKNEYGTEMLLQLIRHFTNGNVLMASISMSRIPKQLREKVMLFKHMLGQQTKLNSFIVLPIVILISKILKLDLHYGLRCWTYQSFEEIEHENYYFDLSRMDSSTTDKKFANLVNIWAWNSALKYDYIDRFMLGVYLSAPLIEDCRYQSLDYSKDLLRFSGFGRIVDYFDYNLTND